MSTIPANKEVMLRKSGGLDGWSRLEFGRYGMQSTWGLLLLFLIESQTTYFAARVEKQVQSKASFSVQPPSFFISNAFVLVDRNLDCVLNKQSRLYDMNSIYLAILSLLVLETEHSSSFVWDRTTVWHESLAAQHSTAPAKEATFEEQRF